MAARALDLAPDQQQGSLPWPVLGLILVAGLLVLRVISNKLTFGRPPVLEGVPFVGGVLKFMGVSLGTGSG